MGKLVVVNATHLKDYANQALHKGKSAFERVLDFARMYTAAENILIVACQALEQQVPEQFNLELVGEPQMHSVLLAIAEFAGRKATCDTVLYLHADWPLYDAQLTLRLLELHAKYRAEYTFADGYPPGFAPELLHPRVLPNLVQLAGKHQITADREGLFNVIQKDINSYDIETELSPRDVRSYRFTPVCDSRRNFLAVENLLALGLQTADQVVHFLPDHPELLRTLPAFIWIQITEGCLQSCSYCPYPQMVGDPRGLKNHMPVSDFKKIVDDAAALCDEVVIDISLWGEPALHPDFFSLAEAVLAYPRTSLLIETAGLGWNQAAIDGLMAKAAARIHWIISLDSSDPALYSRLRGDGLAEAQAFAETMGRAYPGQTHVQAVRMQHNEDNLEAFYRGWIKLNDKVIIQKYDSFASTLPDLQVADLSPLQRMPCRHLARDMAILLDGSVPMCKHGLVKGGNKLEYPWIVGNVLTDGVAKVWQQLDAYYVRHSAGAYPAVCERCDEYHTFNA